MLKKIKDVREKFKLFIKSIKGNETKKVIFESLLHLGLVTILLAVIYMQYKAPLTKLEGNLLSFLYLIPLFIAVSEYGKSYGFLITAFAFLSNLIFPSGTFGMPGHSLGVSIIQSAIFIFVTFYITKSKNTTKTLQEVKEEEIVLQERKILDKQDILDALLKVIDAKDAYTYRHSKRVSYYAKMIALHMSLPDETVNKIYISGMLHDIGKIGVKESILNKTARLDENEFEDIKKHPVIGAHIAQNLEFLSDVIPGIYSHHESFNGTGYPQGLKGDEIPLIARIMAVADSFDAMTTDRVYRPALPVEVALRQLIDNIGIQFDPYVVITFADLIKNKSVLIDKNTIP